jgi:hypothetical protein
MAIRLRPRDPAALDWVEPMPFPAIQSMFDPLLPKRRAVVLEGRLRQGVARPGD